jgi:hypothetical protein
LSVRNGTIALNTDIDEITLEVSSFAAGVGNPALNGQMGALRLTLVDTPNNHPDPRANADFVYFTDFPRLGSFRLFENTAAFGAIPIRMRVGSLILVGFGQSDDSNVGFFYPTIGVVPEPSSFTLTLLLVGIAGLVTARRRP